MPSELEEQLWKAWVEVLAKCIQDANRKGSLKKVIRSRGYQEALDWIGHRVMFAKNKPTVSMVVQEITHGLSLQAPNLPLETLDFLKEHNKDALRVLRRNYLDIILHAGYETGFIKKKAPTKESLDKALSEFVGGDS
jgi:hypothetical protein